MNEIKELLKEEAIKQVIKEVKSNEYLRIAGNLYLTEAFRTATNKIIFFYPVVNNEVWNMPVFSIVYKRNQVEYFDAVETQGIRKLVKFLRKGGE